MKFSIVIPIYKEKKNLSKLISSLKKALVDYKNKYEIIFVDDDSNDGSDKIFKNIKSKKIRLLIRKEKPRDLSKSVVYGFNRSKNDNLIVMDGDLQHNPRDLRKLIVKFKKTNCDIVIGSRKLINYKEANLNPIRFVFSKLLNHLFNLLFRKEIKDPMSGFFLIKKKVFKSVEKKLILLGYKILIDIVLSSTKKLDIKEVFINFRIRDKGYSKMRLKILIQLVLFLIIKYFRYEKKL